MNASRTQTPELLLVAFATIILGLSVIFDGVRTNKRLDATKETP